MASKLPFKFFDWKQKLRTWSIRINKTFKHKVLSKSRNALIITTSSQDNSNQHFPFEKQGKLSFDTKLKNVLKKTWQIYELKVENLSSNNDYKEIQQRFKGRQYDAVIVMPSSNRNLQGYYNIQQQQFATKTETYRNNLFTNILAYRLAHKYLTTSGVVIFSSSQADFGKVENKNGQLKVTQPALKNIQDGQLSYMAVVVGDRDYTDLNSCSVVGLSEEFIKEENEDFVLRMYSDWADGRSLPMPGSFAIFKMNEEGKKHPFVQYL